MKSPEPEVRRNAAAYAHSVLSSVWAGTYGHSWGQDNALNGAEPNWTGTVALSSAGFFILSVVLGMGHLEILDTVVTPYIDSWF